MTSENDLFYEEKKARDLAAARGRKYRLEYETINSMGGITPTIRYALSRETVMERIGVLMDRRDITSFTVSEDLP